jgi:hypothetical protein
VYSTTQPDTPFAIFLTRSALLTLTNFAEVVLDFLAVTLVLKRKFLILNGTEDSPNQTAATLPALRQTESNQAYLNNPYTSNLPARMYHATFSTSAPRRTLEL